MLRYVTSILLTASLCLNTLEVSGFPPVKPCLQSSDWARREALSAALLQPFRKNLQPKLSEELLRATKEALIKGQVHRLPIADAKRINQARTINVSDNHIGFPFAKEKAFSDFVHQIKPATNPTPDQQQYFIWNGDTVDDHAVWLKKLYRLGARFADIISSSAKASIKRINVLAAYGMRVTILFGNHDARFRTIIPENRKQGNVEIKPFEHIHTLADGRKALIVHGDLFDGIERGGGVDRSFGGSIYDFGLLLDSGLNWLFPKKTWSLLSIKPLVPYVIPYIAGHTLRLVEAAKKAGVEVVISGHVHMPYHMMWDGIEVLGSGDWVENATMVLEDFGTGTLHVMRWDTRAPRPVPVRLSTKLADPHYPFADFYRPPHDNRILDPRDKFDALTEVQGRELAHKINQADVVIGISYHDEKENIGDLVQTLREDLESDGRRAAILVVGEYEEINQLPTHLNDDAGDVRVYCLTKPPPDEFMQAPGPGRRAWTQRLVMRVADRLKADVLFIDANVKEATGRVPLFLNKLQEGARPPLMVSADYEGELSHRESIVYLWDDLFYGAMFGEPIRHREEGEFALSKHALKLALGNQWFRYGLVYDLESQLSSYFTRHRHPPAIIRLPTKHFTLTETPTFLKERLPLLVKSVFEDARIYLPALIASHQKTSPESSYQQSEDNLPMRELIGDYPEHLYIDFVRTFDFAQDILESILGPALLAPFRQVRLRERLPSQITADTWAEATFQFLERYTTALTEEAREEIASAYIPILELGALGYFDRTKEFRFEEAYELLQREYLPAFRHSWRRIAHPSKKKAKVDLSALGLDLLPGHQFEVEEYLENHSIDAKTCALVSHPWAMPKIPVKDIVVIIVKHTIPEREHIESFVVYEMVVLDKKTSVPVAKAELNAVIVDDHEYYTPYTISDIKVAADYRDQALMQRAITLIALTSKRQGWISTEFHDLTDRMYFRMFFDPRLKAIKRDGLWVINAIHPAHRIISRFNGPWMDMTMKGSFLTIFFAGVGLTYCLFHDKVTESVVYEAASFGILAVFTAVSASLWAQWLRIKRGIQERFELWPVLYLVGLAILLSTIVERPAWELLERVVHPFPWHVANALAQTVVDYFVLSFLFATSWAMFFYARHFDPQNEAGALQEIREKFLGFYIRHEWKWSRWILLSMLAAPFPLVSFTFFQAGVLDWNVSFDYGDYPDSWEMIRLVKKNKWFWWVAPILERVQKGLEHRWYIHFLRHSLAIAYILSIGGDFFRRLESTHDYAPAIMIAGGFLWIAWRLTRPPNPIRLHRLIPWLAPLVLAIPLFAQSHHLRTSS